MTPSTNGIFASPPRLIALGTTLAAVLLYLMPVPEGISPAAMHGIAICVFAVGLFATAVLPEHLSALLFLTAAMLIGVAPADVVFAGFYSTAFWLLFGGIIIGVAVQKTGIGSRIAAVIADRFVGSYPSLVVGFVIVGLALSFIMPSTLSRMIMLIPLVASVCDHAGYEEGANERTGLILAACCGTWMPSTAILPSNVPNMILAGVAERVFDLSFTYGNYMLIHMPLSGILKAATIVAAVLLLFPSGRASGPQAYEPKPVMPMKADGARLALIIAVTIALWATDFLHHISPAWIGMAAGIACMIPGIGPLTPDDFKTKVSFPSLIYVGGILGIGAVLVETGAGTTIGGWLLAHLPLSPDAPFTSFMSMIGLGMAVNLASTAPSVPAIVGPLAGQIADLTDFPIEAVFMSQVIAYTNVILPYQVPPLIVGLHLGGVSIKDGAKMTVALAVVSVLVICPLSYLWWGWLGLLG